MSDTGVTSRGISPTECILLEYMWSCFHTFDGGLREPSQLLQQVPIRYPLFKYLLSGPREIDTASHSLLTRVDLLEHVRAADIVVDGLWPLIHDYVRWNCSDIVGRIPCEAIVDVVQSGEYDKIVSILDHRLTFERKASLSEVARLSESYRNAVNASDEDRVETESQFMTDFAARTSMTERALRTDRLSKSIVLFSYRGDGIVLNRAFNLIFVVVNGARDSDEEIQRVKRVLDRGDNDILVVLLLACEIEIGQRIREVLYRKRAVSLNASAIKDIGLADDPLNTLGRHIISQLPPATLSPYKTTGPVTGDVFFGRQGELRRIIETPRTHHAIVGARRIGKTSLLLALRERINGPDYHDSMIAAYVDAGHDTKMSLFQEHIIVELCAMTEAKPKTFPWIDPGPSFFHDLKHALRYTGYTFLILVDEIDAILAGNDNEKELETFIRSAANGGHVRFVCAGYKTLYSKLQDRSSPLHNLFESIALGPLKLPEAEELVRVPMSHIYVDVANENVLNLLLERGSTFPWLLQAMCNLLLESLDEEHGRRTIRDEDVKRAYESRDFTKCLTGWIRERQDSDGSILDFLIIYLMAHAPANTVQEQELYDMLSSVIYPPPLFRVRQSLEYLTATYVLGCDSGRYWFSLPQLKQRLRETESDIGFVIRRLAADYNAELYDN
jgi:hypothetical protein